MVIIRDIGRMEADLQLFIIAVLKGLNLFEMEETMRALGLAKNRK